MSPLFTVIVIILAVLAIIDLIVGVSNDAINFLNSALGSKVAKRWIILTVAAAGILLGVLTSNGMMEVARNGVFHPEMFTFENVMILFVAVMLADVVLLNTFNALGLPTSTTVSLIFELLGASIAVAMFTIWNDPSLSFADLGNYINTEKAMVMISGILLSVVIAFTVGAILMYVSRVIFSFKYAKSLRRYGAIWCGLAIVGIVYFAIFKGMKSSGLISDDFNHLINDHIVLSLGAILDYLICHIADFAADEGKHFENHHSCWDICSCPRLCRQRPCKLHRCAYRRSRQLRHCEQLWRSFDADGQARRTSTRKHLVLGHKRRCDGHHALLLERCHEGG